MKNSMRRLRALFRKAGRARDPKRFEHSFRLFRDVLDSNNRSLEIISKMGDVLGGDYLFDIQFVRRSSALLFEHLHASLGFFDQLTGSRYARLPAVVAGIEGAIARVIEDAEIFGGEQVVWLDAISGDTAGSVGGKIANLAEVRTSLGLKVPDGFAVTIHAFDAFLRHNRAFEKVKPLDPGQPPSPQWREDITELILHGEVPAGLHRALEKALRKLRSRCGKDCSLAVRSSAAEEDGEVSFAGQYRTVLNVAPDIDALEKAYRRVVASLYSERAAAYQEQLGYDPMRMKMAVGVMVMADAVSSGVLYTADPSDGADRMVISAAWGLGASVVGGRTDADLFHVEKRGKGAAIERRIGDKDAMTVRTVGGGTNDIRTPEDKRRLPSLSDGEIERLAEAGMAMEKHFRRPQDIEWTIDGSGTLFILQCRPLRSVADLPAERERMEHVSSPRIELRKPGEVVLRGAVAGRVHVLKSPRELDSIARGAILVARHDSPDFVRAMPILAAIITDTGGPASHMASLAREFRVPTVVNTGDATKVLEHGREVTLVVDDGGAAVYAGRAEEALAAGDGRPGRLMEDLFEFRRKRLLLRFIAPLNLVDPLRDDFTPEACRTVHDVLRFIHEKSVAHLIDAADLNSGSPGAVNLDLSIPADITVIDIGGGLQNTGEGRRVTAERIASVPFKALIEGMTHPAVWRSEAVPLSVHDFVTSMFHAPDIVSAGARQPERNVAVISKEYVHANLTFGYHFAVLDCYCSVTARNNHIYFRFAGGATDLTKKSRRLRVIEAILAPFGFSIRTKGDLIIARLSNVPQDEMAAILDQIGRLISYTRQLDARLHDDAAVALYVKHFQEGIYGSSTDRERTGGR